MAPLPPAEDHQGTPHGVKAPANFTDPLSMLGASAALLYRKIQRGRMGTGMPNWGPILIEERTWALLAVSVGLPDPGQSGHFAQPSGHRPRWRENPRPQ